MIDAMVVREMVGRCNYDKSRVDMITRIVKGDSVPKTTPSEYDRYMVRKLWGLYEKSGFFSSRFLEFIDHDNIQYIDKDVLVRFLGSLPEKPFDIIAIHD